MVNHPNRSQTPAFRAAELAALLARHYPAAPTHWVAEIVGDMQRATRIARHHAGALCSYEWAESKRDGWAVRDRNAEARINARLADFALSLPGQNPHRFPLHPAPATVTLGGDPRGPCGRLVIPDQRGDGWGEGFAIY